MIVDRREMSERVAGLLSILMGLPAAVDQESNHDSSPDASQDNSQETSVAGDSPSA